MKRSICSPNGRRTLMVALELVVDRATKQPIDKATIATVSERVYEKGVTVRVSGNNINGAVGS